MGHGLVERLEVFEFWLGLVWSGRAEVFVKPPVGGAPGLGVLPAELTGEVFAQQRVGIQRDQRAGRVPVHREQLRGLQSGSGKSFAIALPSETAGRVSRFFDAKLGPDEAFEIDCLDIHRHTDTGREEFVKGFVIIESPLELDVVAVYTAAGKTRFIETMEIEHVAPRGSRGGLADLVPLPDPNPGTAFCRLIQQGPDKGKLLVTVNNQGTVDAPPSSTRIEFSSGQVVLRAAPMIPAGGSVDLALAAIPPPCFSPDCSFKITVDLNNDVNESNETNNTATGICIG